MTYLKVDKTLLVNLEYSLKKEILRTNKAGAFCCSTIIDCNTRKYHGLFICPISKSNPEKHVLLSCLDESIVQHNQEFKLALHKYAGDNYEPKGHKYISDFSSSPIPNIKYQVGNIELTKEKILVQDENQLLIRYNLIEAQGVIKLRFRPLLAFRNIHELSKSNLFVNTKYTPIENGITSCLYVNYPKVFMQFNKGNEFTPAPDWYYNIEYAEELERGYDYKEDLYTPGFFELDIKKGESIVFSIALKKDTPLLLKKKFNTEIKKRIPRDNLNTCLANTAQQFFINLNKNSEIIAGYPWLPIQNRDALIALPGLTLPFYDEKLFLDTLKTIESKFKGHLLSNISQNKNTEYPVDIPLWFIWSVQQYGILYGKKNIWKKFQTIFEEIINGYFNEKNLFEVKNNGLIYFNNRINCNSWMNSYTNNELCVERNGYLVDINALWYNGLCFIKELKPKFKNEKLNAIIDNTISDLKSSFIETFWNTDKLYLNDHVNSTSNSQLRPNQIFAASLPYPILDKPQIKFVLDAIDAYLLTPYGIRTLSPIDKNYIPVYQGNHDQRELAAHNGSAWPWLTAHYFEALLKLDSKKAIRFGEQFIEHFVCELQTEGICSISELYHGNPPHKANGAIASAINTGELIRFKNLIDNAYKIY